MEQGGNAVLENDKTYLLFIRRQHFELGSNNAKATAYPLLGFEARCMYTYGNAEVTCMQVLDNCCCMKAGIATSGTSGHNSLVERPPFAPNAPTLLPAVLVARA